MNLFTVFTLVSMNFYVQFGNTYQLDFIVQFLKYNISEMEIKESNKELISKFNFNIDKTDADEYKDVWSFFENTSSSQLVTFVSVSLIIIAQIVLLIIIYATRK